MDQFQYTSWQFDSIEVNPFGQKCSVNKFQTFPVAHGFGDLFATLQAIKSKFGKKGKKVIKCKLQYHTLVFVTSVQDTLKAEKLV